MSSATIPITRGMVAVVDEADLPMLSRWSWHANRRHDGRCYYAMRHDGVRMHRLILGAVDGEIVDHIDGDGLNNRRSNLRIGTQSLNCVNRKRTPGPHLRGARPKNGRWESYIKVGGKFLSLGRYATEAEAHAAYLNKAHKMYGDWMPLPELPKQSDETPGALMPGEQND